ncbi:3602_t:CDS:2 [Ambispora gerdemannii]|uniref:3602_t:CDS:1 n=1 Tax=Ambispora gerdemannii TaxID=144530 RepID=A0A9N9H9A8_9GLOM|nr:3602_t:CDS:2 [Ambispora gerdemannii]
MTQVMLKNTDVLRCIFEYLSKRDQYTCARVNRKFCIVVISFIWATPFGTSCKRNVKVLKNYFLFFDDKNILQPMYHKTSTSTQALPLFDYPSYLKELRLDELFISLNMILRKHYPCTKSSHDSQLNKLICALLDMFLAHQVKLKKIFIDKKFKLNIHAIQAFKEQKYSSIFRSIGTLTICQQNFNLKLIEALKDSGCQNIVKKNFEIWMLHHTDISTISSLIMSQKGLVRLRIFDCEHGIDLILPAIKSQAETLRDLELDVVDYWRCLPWTDLAACEKLERLWITNSQHVTPAMVKPLHTASFPYMKDINVNNPLYENCDELNAWFLSRKLTMEFND